MGKKEKKLYLEFAFAAKKHQSKVIHRAGFPSIKFLRMPVECLVLIDPGKVGMRRYIRVK